MENPIKTDDLGVPLFLEDVLETPMSPMRQKMVNWLVVEPPHLKHMLVKLDHFPKFRGESKKQLSFHHLVNLDVSKNRGV